MSNPELPCSSETAGFVSLRRPRSPLPRWTCPGGRRSYNAATSLGVSAGGRAESRPWDLIRLIPAWESELIPDFGQFALSPGPSRSPASRPWPEDSVGLFLFVSWCLGVIAVVTLAWPLNIPLAALAY